MMADHGLPRTSLLLAGWLLGPAAWALDLGVRYAAVALVCDSWGEWLLYAISTGASVMALTGIAIAWRCWKRLPAGPFTHANPAISRAKFLSLGGLLLSSLSLLAILLAVVAVTVLNGGCFK